MASPSRLLGIAVATFAAATLACSDDTTVPVTNDVEGDWIFSERLDGPSVGLVCLDTAYVHVDQDGEGFWVTGSQFGQCRLETGEEFPNEGPVVITDGRITGEGRVTFSFAGCTYSGQIAEGDQRASGTGQCSIPTPLGLVVVTSTWSMRRGDYRPPAVGMAVSGAPLSHGDTLTLTVQVTDDAGLARVGERITWGRALDLQCPLDPPPESDSASVSGTSASRTRRYVVPPCTARAVVSAFAVDTAGNRAETEPGDVVVTLPVSQLSGALADTIFTVGDSVTLEVVAENPRGLGWMGYAWVHAESSGRDSVAVSGTSATESFRFEIPEADYPHVIYARVFARHRLGWLTELEIESARTTDAEILPLQSVELPGEVEDAAYRGSDDRIYFLDATVASLYEVALSPLALVSARSLPSVGKSLDLTLEEDAALVALRDELAVAVVPLGGGPTATIAVPPPDDINLYDARWLRVPAHGRALLMVGSGTGGVVMDLDAGTGTTSVRLPSWDGHGRFERAPDRSRVLLVGSGSPVSTRLYLSETDEFLAEQWGLVAGGRVSGDDPLTSWLVGRQLLTTDMVPLRSFSDPSVDWGPSALSLDGTRVYVGRFDGVVEFDAAGGQRVRAIWLPGSPDWLRALPGARVLAAIGSTLFLVTPE